MQMFDWPASIGVPMALSMWTNQRRCSVGRRGGIGAACGLHSWCSMAEALNVSWGGTRMPFGPRSCMPRDWRWDARAGGSPAAIYHAATRLAHLALSYRLHAGKALAAGKRHKMANDSIRFSCCWIEGDIYYSVCQLNYNKVCYLIKTLESARMLKLALTEYLTGRIARFGLAADVKREVNYPSLSMLCSPWNECNQMSSHRLLMPTTVIADPDANHHFFIFLFFLWTKLLIK